MLDINMTDRKHQSQRGYIALQLLTPMSTRIIHFKCQPGWTAYKRRNDKIRQRKERIAVILTNFNRFVVGKHGLNP